MFDNLQFDTQLHEFNDNTASSLEDVCWTCLVSGNSGLNPRT